MRYLISLGANPGTIKEIPYTTDLSFFHPGSPPNFDTQQELRLLYTGQLIERKGLQLFLDELALWCSNHPSRRVRLDIFGSGREEMRLRSIPTPSNLSVVFNGSVPYEELPRVYGKSHIYVFPTFADEWGLVVNEALASGLPVLGSIHSQAVEELITDGTNGWCFDSTDRESTQRVLDRALLASTEQLTLVAEKARHSIAPYTPAAMAERLARLIEEVCSGSHS